MNTDGTTSRSVLRPTARRLPPVFVFLGMSVFALLAGWFSLFAFHPGLKYDPRSPRYLLWKYCSVPMPADAAFATAMRDRDKGRLVIGLTAEELKRKFGVDLRRPGDPKLTAHQQRYVGAGEYGWLGDSWHMVEFQDGRVVTCRLRKG